MSARTVIISPIAPGPAGTRHLVQSRTDVIVAPDGSFDLRLLDGTLVLSGVMIRFGKGWVSRQISVEPDEIEQHLVCAGFTAKVRHWFEPAWGFSVSILPLPVGDTRPCQEATTGAPDDIQGISLIHSAGDTSSLHVDITSSDAASAPVARQTATSLREPASIPGFWLDFTTSHPNLEWLAGARGYLAFDAGPYGLLGLEQRAGRCRTNDRHWLSDPEISVGRSATWSGKDSGQLDPRLSPATSDHGSVASSEPDRGVANQPAISRDSHLALPSYRCQWSGRWLRHAHELGRSVPSWMPSSLAIEGADSIEFHLLDGIVTPSVDGRFAASAVSVSESDGIYTVTVAEPGICGIDVVDGTDIYSLDLYSAPPTRALLERRAQGIMSAFPRPASHDIPARLVQTWLVAQSLDLRCETSATRQWFRDVWSQIDATQYRLSIWGPLLAAWIADHDSTATNTSLRQAISYLDGPAQPGRLSVALDLLAACATSSPELIPDAASAVHHIATRIAVSGAGGTAADGDCARLGDSFVRDYCHAERDILDGVAGDASARVLRLVESTIPGEFGTELQRAQALAFANRSRNLSGAVGESLSYAQRQIRSWLASHCDEDGRVRQVSEDDYDEILAWVIRGAI